MKAFWNTVPHTHGRIDVAAMDYSITAVVYCAALLRGAEWTIFVKHTIIETGESDTVQGAKVQATRAAKDWRTKLHEDQDR